MAAQWPLEAECYLLRVLWEAAPAAEWLKLRVFCGRLPLRPNG
jgi:hypothetical protein